MCNCNITQFEAEIAIRKKKFQRKLFNLVADTDVGVEFQSLSALGQLL